MKRRSSPARSARLLKTFTLLFCIALPLAATAQTGDPLEKVVAPAEKSSQDLMRPSPGKANAQAQAPLVERVEKGAEPHVRFGYDRPFTEQEEVKPRHKTFQYMPDASALGTESMLAELSQEVAGKVFYELKEEGHSNLAAKVAVVAAVPLSDLKRESEFGRMIAEYYLTDLADRGLQVTELRMGSDINILPQTGEFLLSRNIGEIANNTPAIDYVVVSTFTNTRKTLILQGRLISLKSGLVKTSWRYNLPLNRELLGLFQSPEQQPFTIAVKGIGQ